MSFEIIAGNIGKSSLVGFNKTWHNDAGRNISYTHKEKLYERNLHTGNFGRKPKEKRHKMEKHRKQYHRSQHYGRHKNIII